MNAGYHTGDYVFNFAQRFHETVPDTVTFAFNSAALDENAKAALRRQAHFIRQFPEVRWKVFGHTDLVGSNYYNKRLGLRRAQAVVAYLASQGVSRKRLQAVVSYGETRPVIATQDRERQNRRTVTEVSGFVQNAPLILDGKYAQVIQREYVESATEIPPPSGAAILEAGGDWPAIRPPPRQRKTAIKPGRPSPAGFFLPVPTCSDCGNSLAGSPVIVSIDRTFSRFTPQSCRH